VSFLAHIPGKHARHCYLADAAETCAVCWKTNSQGARTQEPCPAGAADIRWAHQLPTDMKPSREYPVSYKLTIDTSIFLLVLIEPKRQVSAVPHSNIHSCLNNGNPCTPFVPDSPGMSTHTPAVSRNLTQLGVTKEASTFDATVKLPEGKYTIIAHCRFHVVEQTACAPTCLNTYDIAVGVAREVSFEQSVDGYITSFIVGGVMVLFTGSGMWAARTGRISIDAIISAATRDEVCNLAEIIMVLGDASAFTVGVKQEILNDRSLEHVVPLSIFFMCTGWAVAIASAIHKSVMLVRSLKGEDNFDDLLNMWAQCALSDMKQVDPLTWTPGSESSFTDEKDFEEITEERLAFETHAALHAMVALGYKSKRRSCRTRWEQHKTSMLQSAQFRLLLKNYAGLREQLFQQYTNLLSLLFADMPMSLIGMYVLVKGNSPDMVVVVALCLSSIFLGSKVGGLGGFSGQTTQLREIMSVMAEILQNRIDPE